MNGEKYTLEFYSKGLYSDLWYQWKGKPLIMADINLCSFGGGSGDSGSRTSMPVGTAGPDEYSG